MKIAMVIENFDPLGGGAERNVAETASGLSQRGHDVTVLAAWGARGARGTWGVRGVKCGEQIGGSDVGSESEGVSTLNHGLIVGAGDGGGRKLKSSGRLRRFACWAESQLASGGYDVTLSVTPAVRAMVMQPLGGTYRETLIRNRIAQPTGLGRLARQVMMSCSSKRRALLSMERRTYADSQVRAIAALSRYVVWQLMAHYAIASEKITVISNAVDASRLTVSPETRLATRAAYGIADDEIVYLFSAFNPRLKGFASLLEATRRVRQRGVRAIILAVGRYRRSERAMIRAAGLTDAVRIVGVTQDVAAMYAAADVTVVPTFYDTGSRVVIESLLAGRPVISTRQCGADEWIEPAGMSDGPDGLNDQSVQNVQQIQPVQHAQQIQPVQQAQHVHPVQPAPPVQFDPSVRPVIRRGRVISDARDVDALAQAMIELADARVRQDCVSDVRNVGGAGLADDVSIDRHVDQLESLLSRVAGFEGDGSAGRG